MHKKILHLNVKKEWFDKIASGEKTIEYREYKNYWSKRLSKGNFIIFFDEIYFKNGYSKTAPFMRIKHIKTDLIDGLNTDLKIDKKVFAIHLGEILEIRR